MKNTLCLILLLLFTLPAGASSQDTSTSPEAITRENSDSLRLRASPDEEADVISLLNANTPLQVLGRTEEIDWLEVQTADQLTGWIATEFVVLLKSPAEIPVTWHSFSFGAPTSPSQKNPIITGITDRSREIFRSGQQLGNRADVFSKIGDSITVASYVFYPIGWGDYNLAEFSYLEPTIRYFSQTPARNGQNSFANDSLAADNGWTTQTVLNPQITLDGSTCLPQEPPLLCEYRIVQPAFALVLLGTNDLATVPNDAYRENLEQIVTLSINRGIVPVLSTIPERLGFYVGDRNNIVLEVAAEYEVPVWHYHDAMKNAPNTGLSDDGVHPSFPDGDIGESANFQQENLQYGYVIRNLTALEVLDALRQQIILASP